MDIKYLLATYVINVKMKSSFESIRIDVINLSMAAIVGTSGGVQCSLFVHVKYFSVEYKKIEARNTK